MRPSNVIVVDTDTYKSALVDWGASLPLDAQAQTSGHGVMSFASDAVGRCFESHSTAGVAAGSEWAATAAVDLEPVAYLYAAMALGGSIACAPLWHNPQRLLLSASDVTVDSMANARSAWFYEHRAQLGGGVFSFLERVRRGETPYNFEF